PRGARAWSRGGRSGSRSIERRRKSSGQVLKSAARDGDNEGSAVSISTVMPQRLGHRYDEIPEAAVAHVASTRWTTRRPTPGPVHPSAGPASRWAGSSV